MPHAIILSKNRDLAKSVADANVTLNDAHDFIHNLASTDPLKAQLETALDNLSDMLSDFTSDYQGAIDSIHALASGD